MAHRSAAVIPVALLLLAIAGGGCIGSGAPDEGFAVYLRAVDVGSNAAASSLAIELEGEPLFSAEDIIAYDAETHTIELRPEAYARLDASELAGRPFIVCRGREPVYAGAFVSPYFCRSFEMIVIELPSVAGTHCIRLQPGYPERPDLFSDGDPRSDTRLMRALQSAGKLRE